MELRTYRYQAEMLVNDYLLAYSLLPYISIVAGILLSKMGVDLIRSISSCYFTSYSTLSKIQRMEWNNRGMSSIHAIYITTVSLFLVFFSDLYSDAQRRGLITFRSSPLSIFSLGVSVGYFATDLAVICWSFPFLGGMEFVFHHLLSLLAISYSMFSGEGQLYTFMVLISEATTPGINLRWYLDTLGKKSSGVYVINGILVFFQWLRNNEAYASTMSHLHLRLQEFCFFVYFFYHVFQHYDQVEEMHFYSYLLVFVVPFVLAIMNMIWFAKILRGLMKTIAKMQ